ncbi:hypothetical protein A4X06_0g3063 [Tilletia controversa]|uniref:DNA topoisomerase (ATP-hydrolyzing) n=1 Tax=Tilletia controversa TaxID=13291 RepID=A0A8X7MWH5_9BASI|nr:hypothetical protein A4X06_0g3063 [Tilletia controversa]
MFFSPIFGPSSSPAAQAFKILEESHSAATSSSFITKRDLFYRDVALFKRQTSSDAHIASLCSALDVDREALGIRAAAKGLLTGSFRFQLRRISHVEPVTEGALAEGEGHQHPITWLQGSSVSEHLVPFVHDIETFQTQAAWVLVVEKEAIFQVLRQHDFASGSSCNLKPGLVITGKGYPDQATQQFLVFLAENFKDMSFFALTDGDPHGIDIFRMYKYGNGTADRPGRFAVKRLQWLGLRTVDFMQSGRGGTACSDGGYSQHCGGDGQGEDEQEALVSQGTLPIGAADRRKAESLLSNHWLSEDLKSELRYMLQHGCKAELEVLFESTRGGCATSGADKEPWMRAAVGEDEERAAASVHRDPAATSVASPIMVNEPAEEAAAIVSTQSLVQQAIPAAASSRVQAGPKLADGVDRGPNPSLATSKLLQYVARRMSSVDISVIRPGTSTP